MCHRFQTASVDVSAQEVAIENVGPVDDGTESLGDAPSLSEEVAGIHQQTGRFKLDLCLKAPLPSGAAEFKPADVPVETVLSEEGHQVGDP